MRPGAPRSSGARRAWRARSARCTTARACSTSRPSPPASACRRGRSALSLCPASVVVMCSEWSAVDWQQARRAPCRALKGAPGAAGSWQRRSRWWRRCRARLAAATPCAATWTRSLPWPPRQVTFPPAAPSASALRAAPRPAVCLPGPRRRGGAPGEDVRAGGAVAEDVDYFDAADLGGLRRRLRRAIEDKQREQELYLEIVARYLQARPRPRATARRAPAAALQPPAARRCPTSSPTRAAGAARSRRPRTPGCRPRWRTPSGGGSACCAPGPSGAGPRVRGLCAPAAPTAPGRPRRARPRARAQGGRRRVRGA